MALYLYYALAVTSIFFGQQRPWVAIMFWNIWNVLSIFPEVEDLDAHIMYCHSGEFKPITDIGGLEGEALTRPHRPIISTFLVIQLAARDVSIPTDKVFYGHGC